MARIVVDPVSRIEGHLRIEANLEGGKLTDAWSSGTMFRGIEMVLQGRDPREAWIWAQRICGVCTMVHAIASVRAVEDALKIEVPENARIIRNLIAGAQMVHDHVVHFYHLHALDWVDVASALKADPGKTSSIAQSISNAEKSSATYFRGVQQRVKAVVDSGQLSLFASGYWGHPAYLLPPELNLLAVAHYLEALAWQKDFIRIHAVLGGKNPHPQSFLVGGMSTSMDPNEPAATITPERIQFIRDLCTGAKKFVDDYYLPDVLAIAPYYKDWFGRGEGLGNFLCYGDYSSGDQTDPKTFLFPRGIVMGRDLTKVLPVDPSKITESVAHSWYDYSDGNKGGLHPSVGETNPKYSGPKAPFAYLDTDQKYSWLKTPRVLWNRRSWPTSWKAGWISWDRIWRTASSKFSTRSCGIRVHGRNRPKALAGMKHRAALWATGWRLRTEPLRTTRPWCRQPGTPGPATTAGNAAHTRHRWLARRWRTRTGRSKSCEPSTRSTRVSPARCM